MSISQPPGHASSLLTTCAKYAALVLAAGYLLSYLLLALLHLRYPFELQWMEGSSLDHVARVLAGKALYVRPTLDFVSYIYTPFYLYLAAGAAKLLGSGFFPLRLISLLASLGVFWLIFRFVYDETRHRAAGLCAVGLFAATYHVCEGWFDIARVDTLFLFLLLAALYLLRVSPSLPSGALAGLLLALAFFTKQTALFSMLAVLLYSLFFRRRQGLLTVSIAGALIGGSTWLLNRLSGGWYLFYIFRLPAQHRLDPSKFISFWTLDLLLWLPIACLAAVGYFILCREKSTRCWYALMALGVIGGAWSARLHSCGYINTVMPVYAILAILAGFTLARAVARRPAMAYLACLLQLALLVYNPLIFLPTRADLAAGRQVQAQIARLPGEVYLPFQSYLGKRTYAHAMAVYDVDRGTDRPLIAALDADILSAFAHRRFSAVILDARRNSATGQLDEPFWYQRELDANYYPARLLIPDPNAFWPVTGVKMRPQMLYLPKPPAHR